MRVCLECGSHLIRDDVEVQLYCRDTTHVCSAVSYCRVVRLLQAMDRSELGDQRSYRSRLGRGHGSIAGLKQGEGKQDMRTLCISLSICDPCPLGLVGAVVVRIR